MAKKKGIKIRFPRLMKNELLIDKPLIKLSEDFLVDPKLKAEEQGNEDKLMFILDPDNKATTSYKMIKKLPEEVESEKEEDEIRVEIVGYVRSSDKEDKTFKTKKDEDKQDEKIIGVLNEDKEHAIPVLEKKPGWHKVIGYIPTKDSTPNHLKYVAVIKRRSLFIIWLLGIGAGLMFMFMTLGWNPVESGTAPELIGDIWDGIRTEIEERLDIEAEMIAIPGYPKIVLDDYYQMVDLINPNENCYMNYLIYDENDNLMFESKWIKENSEVKWHAYPMFPGKGQYKVRMEIQTMDNINYTGCNSMSQDVDVVVQ